MKQWNGTSVAAIEIVRINKKHLLALIGKASWEIGCTELENAPDFIFQPIVSDVGMTNTSPT